MVGARDRRWQVCMESVFRGENSAEREFPGFLNLVKTIHRVNKIPINTGGVDDQPEPLTSKISSIGILNEILHSIRKLPTCSVVLHSYPLTEPAVSPLTRCRWTSAKNSTAGNANIAAAAIISGHSTEYSVWKLVSPTDITHFLDVKISDRAKK